jgi:hypothetical protein
MSGTVKDAKGAPVEGATVIATHGPSGTQYYSETDKAGNYRIPGMRVGGPYTVKVTLLGYGSAEAGGAVLRLGENFVQNLVLSEKSEELSQIVVSGKIRNPILNSDKNGASTNVTERQINDLPTISRSITDFTRLTPQANGNSFAGVDGRMNSITIDGANFNNNFGLSSNLMPGGDAQPISLDAIQEINVNVAPFDIRQSQFTGAAISAITKSGTNEYKGSAYTFIRPKTFTGNKVGDLTVDGAHDSKSETYGFTFGGPIIKNKLFFFVSGEYGKTTSPSGAWKPSTDGIAHTETKTSRTSISDLKTMHDYLLSKYDYEAGDYQNFRNFTSDNHKILARIDWNINKYNKVTVRYNDMVGTSDNLASSSGPCYGSGRSSAKAVEFSNAWYGFKNTVRSLTGEWNATFSPKVNMRLLASYTATEDKRTSDSGLFPFVDIYKDNDRYMSFGYELFSHNNDVKNNTLSISDNVTFNLNRHTITVGVSYDNLYFKNSYMREGTSYYCYDSMEAFMNNETPSALALTYGYNGNEAPGVELTFGLGALYAQDEWQVNDKLKLTYGLRVERPFFLNDLDSNPAVDAYKFGGWDKGTSNILGKDAAEDDPYYIKSGSWPKAKLQFSPRLGFNWDVRGDRSLQVRGGTGLFSGLLPFVWFTNQPNGSGMIQSPETIIKDKTTLEGAGVKFTPDYHDLIKNYPTLFPTTPGKLPYGSNLAEVDKDFKMPQNWRTDLAVDIALPWNMVFTVEDIFTKNINAVTQKNVNLSYPDATFNGADDRPYWSSSSKINSNVGTAMVLTNTSKGFQNSLTFQLTKNMSNGLSGSFAYTYTVSKDVTANPGSSASSAWKYNVVRSYLNDPELSYSEFAVPSRFVGNLTYRINYAKHFASTFGLYFTASQQGRASFTYSNDLNGDGYTADLLYIPKSSDELTFTDYNGMTADQQAKIFWNYVNTNSYLSKHKGKYAARWGYVEPWHTRWDFKYVQDIFSNFGSARKYTLKISLDILNVGNLLNNKWGCYRDMGNLSYGNITPLRKDKIINGVPVYHLNAKSEEDFNNSFEWVRENKTSSTWGMLLGFKFIF